jgi:small GTP-binding protein
MSARKKIMLLGDIGVGKTSLIRRLVLDKFEGTYKGTLGFDLYTFTVDQAGPTGSDRVPLVIWDTDGNVGVNILRHDVYMQGTSAALLVADATRPETHTVVADLAAAFAENFPGRPFAFVMNKSDLVEGHPVIPTPLQPHVAAGHPLIHTSAKTGDNVVAAFRLAATAILRRGL